MLTSVKSIQSCHLSFSFLTRTTLANQSGYSTSRIALACKSLLTSSSIAFCLSGAKLLLFCLTGLKEGLMFSLCVITAGLIPPHILLLLGKYFHVLFQEVDEGVPEDFG